MSVKRYLTPEQLVGFENYKYSAQDTSPLSNYVMHPFWNTVVKICPRWIAPNVLTFVGFLFTVANFVLLSFYDYSYYASSVDIPPETGPYPPVPNWVWIVCALNHFLAHTLDGIDGKQARRTGTSGPLGELFDHGLDSWTTFFIPACIWSIFGRADYSISPLRFYFILWNVLSCFYTSHWEKYLTKILFLPWGYDISQALIFAIYLVTGIWGQQIWKFEIVQGISSGAMFEFMMYAGSLGTSLPMSFWNVYKSYRDETGKMLGFWEAVRPLITPLIFFALSTIWVYQSPTNIIERDPRMVLFMVGTIFANVNCRLIVSQMSSTRCELLNWLLLPLAVAVGIAITFPTLELATLLIMGSIATVAHIHYGVYVVRQMCDHFHIKCFSIKDRTE
ncbi:ethanolaminephosphotransferase 1 isoform X1 [Penaeus vannamei]|uniref:Putative ethanolaminephosphotransferase 1-like n=1 Tax=Penaeus vannamei TaxID=6689 RepID=A0A3R7MB07_PENVA|nr:ethanolaminephosphotransferase 1-like [Penaeus vannamei]ROT71779.1 putative ethanolaminephosphotransferase 1-like [Penaeus vannamei]